MNSFAVGGGRTDRGSRCPARHSANIFALAGTGEQRIKKVVRILANNPWFGSGNHVGVALLDDLSFSSAIKSRAVEINTNGWFLEDAS